MKKVLKILLIALVVLALGAVCVVGPLLGFYPWWLGLAVTGATAALWLTTLFVKRFLVRRRERQFVERVIEQDNAAIERAPAAQAGGLRDLQSSWRESVELLRRSDLRRRGNPLYVLPWYLVIGESGAGKTSSIRGANLHSPLNERHASVALSVTRNCDWWFFEDAIMLDSAGRYSVPLDEDADRKEWHKFLVLLSRYRRREPINGVVVVIPADKLNEPDTVALQSTAEMLRMRVDETMRAVGARFPVYVLITKMDLVLGMSEFFGYLPRRAASQPMGYLNRDCEAFSSGLLQKIIGGIGRQLRSLRLAIIHQEYAPEPEVFAFPREFERLTQGMELFLTTLFSENAYQETPLFRGLYFSSAHHETRARPEGGEQATGAEDSAPETVRSNRGTFLRDFYRLVLPNDRYLHAPLRAFLHWRRMTHLLGGAAWGLLWIVLLVVTVAIYRHNRTIIGSIPQELRAGTDDRIKTLDRLNREIERVHEENASWVGPRLGLGESLRLEKRLKQRFVHGFSERYLVPFDARVLRVIGQIERQTPNQDVLDVSGYLAARIGLLRDRLDGREIENPVRFCETAARFWSTRFETVGYRRAIRFAELYLDYLAWTTDEQMLHRELQNHLEALGGVIERKGRTLSWCLARPVYVSPDITVEGLWRVDSTRPTPRLSGAFTQAGRDEISAFLRMVEEAIVDVDARLQFRAKQKRFWRWYENEFYQAWHDFLLDFAVVYPMATAREPWRTQVFAIRSGADPYWNAVDTAAAELRAFGKTEPNAMRHGDWVRLLINLVQVHEEALRQQQKKATLVEKVAEKGDELFSAGRAMADSAAAARADLYARAAPVWQGYREQLKKIAKALGSRESCYETMAAAFPAAEQGTGDDDVSTAFDKLNELRGMLDPGDVPDAMWRLISGGVRFLADYGMRETACELQRRWTRDVFLPTRGVERPRKEQMLFEQQNGVVWQFVDKDASPFIDRSPNGYFAMRGFGDAVPFTEEFIHFLNAGAEGTLVYQPFYLVTLEALPMAVNPEAIDEPQESVVKVDCADGNVRLENQNYPRNLTFKWSPDKCGDVVVRIYFSRLVLTKRYEGRLGLARFLADFRDGSRRFSIAEFPVYEEHLANRNIKWIQLTYRIQGAEPVMQLLKTVPDTVPQNIIACWSPQD